MPMTTLPIGQVFTMVQNTVYALPARVVTAAASAAIETSLDGTTFSAVVLTNNQAALAAQFVRSTLADTLIILKT